MSNSVAAGIVRRRLQRIRLLYFSPLFAGRVVQCVEEPAGVLRLIRGAQVVPTQVIVDCLGKGVGSFSEFRIEWGKIGLGRMKRKKLGEPGVLMLSFERR